MNAELQKQLQAAFNAGVNKGIEHYQAGTPVDSRRDFWDYVENVMGENPTHTYDTVNTVAGYEDLSSVLNRAFEQAAFGKGDERHAGGKAFRDQPIIRIQKAVGHGYARGQAIKKVEETEALLGLGRPSAGVAELLGAIVYIAGAVIYIEGDE